MRIPYAPKRASGHCFRRYAGIPVRWCFLFLACLLSLATPAMADMRENPESLKTLVTRFVEANVKAGSGEDIVLRQVSIDETLNLEACKSPVHARFADAQGTPNTVILQCLTPPGWTLYVPVLLETMANVIVTPTRLMPGEYIDVTSLEFEKRPVQSLFEGYFRDTESLHGMSAMRMLPPGTVLTPKNVRRVPLIHRNQSISLIARKGPIEVSMSGIAKSDGYLHEHIKVLNPSSRKIVDAVVTGSDRAEIS